MWEGVMKIKETDNSKEHKRKNMTMLGNNDIILEKYSNGNRASYSFKE
jgi:hypothetical protein